MTDPFDPTTWSAEPEEHRLYTHADCSTWVYLDYIDYVWAIQWLWHVNRPHPKRSGKKLYTRRSQSNGRRYLPPIYLHIEIMKRTGAKPRTVNHVLVDHIDGNEHNCRRSNLSWATHAENTSNIKRNPKSHKRVHKSGRRRP